MSNFLYAVEREYPVAIETLWNAWVDAKNLEQWYSPTELSVTPGAVVSDARVGGWWTVGVDVPAHSFTAYFYGKYTEVVEHQKLVHTMMYTQSRDEFEARDLSQPRHVVEVEFEARGNSSWVKFSQFGELPDGEAPRAQAGMQSYLDNLGLFLDRTSTQ